MQADDGQVRATDKTESRLVRRRVQSQSLDDRLGGSTLVDQFAIAGTVEPKGDVECHQLLIEVWRDELIGGPAVEESAHRYQSYVGFRRELLEVEPPKGFVVALRLARI